MKTPLYEIHKSYGAKIVDFHGWGMPLQYSGIIDEHVNARTKVCMFDVSHMGRFEVRGPNALDCLQILATNDVSKLKDYSALYSPFCYDDGGIVDDLIIYRKTDEKFLLVVNASNRDKDLEWVTQHRNSADVVDISDKTILLAVQGPLARHVMEKVTGLRLDGLKAFEFTIKEILGAEALISRTGYTGEDGFEILLDASKISIWDKIMTLGSDFGIKPAGLGARDTLRLEAGLMLYGNDIDKNVTPLEAPLKWTVKFEKPEFIGKAALARRQYNRKLVGFELLEKRIARHGNEVFLEGSGQKIGFVTSGSFSPSLKKSIGFCFVPNYVSPSQLVEIVIGGKHYQARVKSSTRFYKPIGR